MKEEEIRKRTQETAKKLFGGGVKMDPPYLMWKEFDRGLANDFSMFITGNLYSRTVLTLPERQMAACAMLAAIRAGDELRLHVNAALNVGCDPKKLAEVFSDIYEPVGICLGQAIEDGSLPERDDTHELARFIINSWQGAMLAQKVEDTPEPLELFEKYILDHLL